MTTGSIDIDDAQGDVSGVIKDLFKNSYTFNISSSVNRMLAAACLCYSIPFSYQPICYSLEYLQSHGNRRVHW